MLTVENSKIHAKSGNQPVCLKALIGLKSRMGNEASTQTWKASDSNYAALAQQTHFTVDELKRLHYNFLRLSESRKHDNLIDAHEFQTAIGMKSEGFAKRIFSAFDSSDNMNLDFTEFAKGLSSLTPKASIEEKSKFCFRIYDIDHNGCIDKDELKEVIRFSIGENSSVVLGAAQIDNIISQTFAGIDGNADGLISFDEFLAEARKNPSILNCVNLDTAILFA